MKSSPRRLAILAVAATSYPLLLSAQPRSVQLGSLDALLADVKAASQAAGVVVEDRALEQFGAAARDQSASFSAAYSSVPEDVRILRIKDYLELKAQQARRSGAVQVGDVSDFNWAYVSADVDLKPIQVRSQEILRLTKLESGGRSVDFGGGGVSVSPGSTILVPYRQGSGDSFAALLRKDGKQSLWSGSSGTDAMEIQPASSTRGCEVSIKSSPSRANVWVKGRAWHSKTDTAVIVEPGLVQVELRLDGYVRWSEQRQLAVGDTWSIQASLKKL